MAEIHRLRERQARNAKPLPGRRSILISDGACLYLQATVGSDGTVSRSWVFRYERFGERHDLGLGPLHTRGLHEARAEAKRLRQQILDGIDPLSARREGEREQRKAKAERAKAMTFRQCAKAYYKVHADKWKNARHRAQWWASLESHIFPAIGNLAVADVATEHVRRALEPIWQRIPETAGRVRGRIESVLQYATAAKLRSGDNPAAWGMVKHLLGTKRTVDAHHAALPFADVPPFFAELRQRPDSATRAALLFTILTAARTGEVLGAQWAEIDLQGRTWVVPPTRMKSGREHRVPLGDGAVAILKALPRTGGFVFHAPGRNKKLEDRAMREVLNRMRPGATVHGFRSSFRDWCAERTAFPREVCEMALAHAVGDKVEAAYRRGDLFEKRRQLMAAWDTYLSKPIPAEGADILHIAAKRQ
jgi:integrase